MTTQFSPIEYSSDLQAAGVPGAQAEVHARALTVVMAEVAFARDLVKLETNLREEIHQTEERLVCRIDKVRTEVDKVRMEVDKVRTELSARIEAVRMELSAKIDTLRTEMNARIDVVVSQLSARIDRLEVQVASVHTELVIHRWLFGVLLALNSTTLAIVLNRLPG